MIDRSLPINPYAVHSLNGYSMKRKPVGDFLSIGFGNAQVEWLGVSAMFPRHHLEMRCFRAQQSFPAAFASYAPPRNDFGRQWLETTELLGNRVRSLQLLLASKLSCCCA